MTSNSIPSNQQRYAGLHQGADAVQRYQRKLDNRLDRLRHTIEQDLLGEVLSGTVFDCTIGIGRFIGRLPRVTRYDGMDLSSEFVGFVRENYPGSEVRTGDLLLGLPAPTASYDNVLCLRSLSAIGNLGTILPEMVRVTCPGGLVVFDYGRRATTSHVKGVRTLLDGDNLEVVLETLNATIVERFHLDAILTRAKIHARVFRFLTGPHGSVVSNERLLAAERALVPFLWQRQIVVLRKNG